MGEGCADISRIDYRVLGVEGVELCLLKRDSHQAASLFVVMSPKRSLKGSRLGGC